MMVENTMHEKCQQPVQNPSMMMEKSWVMMMHQTESEHKEYREEVCFTSEVRQAKSQRQYPSLSVHDCLYTRCTLLERNVFR